MEGQRPLAQTVLAEFDGRYRSFEVATSFAGRMPGVCATDGTVGDRRYPGSDAVP